MEWNGIVAKRKNMAVKYFAKTMSIGPLKFEPKIHTKNTHETPITGIKHPTQ
jgi:hypothetical protein